MHENNSTLGDFPLFLFLTPPSFSSRPSYPRSLEIGPRAVTQTKNMQMSKQTKTHIDPSSISLTSQFSLSDSKVKFQKPTADDLSDLRIPPPRYSSEKTNERNKFEHSFCPNVLSRCRVLGCAYFDDTGTLSLQSVRSKHDKTGPLLRL
jgi:hypothetical protein